MEHNDSRAAQNDSNIDQPIVDNEWLEARFSALELRNIGLQRSVRLLGAVAGTALLATAGLAFGMLGQEEEPDAVVRAQAFVVEDAEGNERGSFSVAEDGAALVALKDRDGRERLRMTVRGEGSPGLAFVDRQDNRRIVLGLLPDETSTLVFADGAGSIRAVLGVSTDERANLVFADQRGVTRAGLGVDERGVGSLMISDEEEDGEPEPVGPTQEDPG